MASLILALVLMTAASFGFAGGAIFQHRSIRAEQDGGEHRALSPRQLLLQLREPSWLLGLGMLGGGSVLHMIALSQAPVSVVQPIGILAVPWSVLLASRIHGYATSRAVWLSVAVTIAGVAGFTAVSTHVSSGHAAEVDELMLGLYVGVCATIAGALLLLHSRVAPAFRSLVMASGGAVLFGLTSALLKALLVQLGGAERGAVPVMVLTGAGVLATAVLGAWMIQQAYALGHPEVVVGAMTTVDPIVAVVFGLMVLGEGVHLHVLTIAAMAALGTISTLGVASLARHHPEVLRRDAR
ncbi:hypothetical protein [Brachybacterium hainanense]|uniref:Multidrug DMT transporter permease n=1 Tax=Brachybacterium hainanense TaxID=1541174 RepID=A0ABV6REN7_9MICO